MQGPSRFGLYLLTLFSTCILVLKIITKEQWFLGTWLYTDLSAVETLFAFLVSMTIMMIIWPVPSKSAFHLNLFPSHVHHCVFHDCPCLHGQCLKSRNARCVSDLWQL